ncbi:protocatechuate 3,4-dioxygenase [Diaphorobacter ruginosibacter]|uniref:Protocatechuate 3,4-dioxygenase n=1 Tax=Diaphorobacter ruginosibacter TaxID=1715720 RepID=A0A7G9RT76_9BURK|nr:dioxygenase [Diaphorobacter ruginosibacter]QNN58801.1 protocatechuate 3,4-dioxygenase [Diaphorobacter ruginosibacter]
MGPQALPPTDPQALLAAVLKANAGTADARLREILEIGIRHLHAFALEAHLTPTELEKGLDFLVAIGQASGPKKHEGILLADILGLATLVQLHDARHALEAGGTEPALIGPFWRANQPAKKNGERICSADTPGARMKVRGRVLSLDGTPLAGARVETWQASPKGLYENQDETQEQMNLRGRFETDEQGCFSFESVRPAGYPVPVDGPCGALLAAQGRHIMRPAHLHFLVVAEGHKVLATQYFDIDDPHAFDDVVFGAVGSLLRRFEPGEDGSFSLDLELRLEPGETRIPQCPIP